MEDGSDVFYKWIVIESSLDAVSQYRLELINNINCQ